MTEETALPTAPEPSDGADVELLGLIDRLAELLERSDLSELEIQSGETGLILRKPVAIGVTAVGTPAVQLGRSPGRRLDGRALDRGARPGRHRPAECQGPADRHLLRVARRPGRRPTSRSAGRSRSARSSASSRR